MSTVTKLIEQWDMDRAAELHALWVESTAEAPYYYAVGPEEFATGIIPVESDDQSCATARSQRLITASDAGGPVGFAHLCASSDVEVDGEDIECGIIRFLAFSPDRREVGHVLLSHSEQIFQAEGLTRIDAFPLYHGYPFHNHKVGILSARVSHVSSLLRESGYRAHDGHLTMERSLESVPFAALPREADVLIEKTEGAGALPDICVRVTVDGEVMGTCRSQSGRTYADLDALESCSYTRWLGVKEVYRRRGFGRRLLRHALHEMRCEGYKTSVLNCRMKNLAALSLYESEGYASADTSLAYFKELST